MSDFFNKYPYTDFHELNLDWVIERVKKLTEDWAATLEEWNSTEEQWQQLYDYVHDYFDNLDVQQEINNKINAMIADGTFVTITTPVIEAKVASMMPATVASQIGDTVASQIGTTVAGQLPDVVSDQIGAAVVTPVNNWLADHITQPTTPVVDDSLSISGAAADAAVTGDLINENAEATEIHHIYYDNMENQGKIISVLSITDNPYYSVSDAIHVKCGQRIIGKTFTNNTSVTVLAECLSDGTLTDRLIIGQNNTDVNIDYTVPYDMYIRLCMADWNDDKGWAVISPYFSNIIDLKSTYLNDKIDKIVDTYNLIETGMIFNNVRFVNHSQPTVQGDLQPGTNTICIVKVDYTKTYYISKLSDTFYNIILYDADMTFIDNLYHYQGNTGSWNSTISIPNTCAYVGFDIDAPYMDTAYFGESIYYPLFQINKTFGIKDNVYINFNGSTLNKMQQKTDASMAAGDIVDISVSDIKQNYVCSFTGKLSGAFDSVFLAHGKAATYSGMWLKVDDTNIYFYRFHTSDVLVATVPHGLTISDYISVTLELLQDQTCKVIINTLGGSFSTTNRWQGSKGNISAGPISCSLTDCILTYYCNDYNKPLWAFGDSYFYDYYTPRWPEIVIRYDYTNVMFDGFGGRTSLQAITSLNKCRAFGTPSQILWCMGMNDPDAGAVNANWLDAYNTLTAYCSSNNIELILSTIPTTPTNDNNYKNAIIRSSGLRYVDIADAVGADGSGSWYSGMLESDQLHPTATGSVAIATRMMLDVPEMYKA